MDYELYVQTSSEDKYNGMRSELSDIVCSPLCHHTGTS